MVQPIKPENVVERKAELLPDHVINAWNNMIARNFKNGKAVIGQNDAIEELKLGMEAGIPLEQRRAMIFEKGWLDIENVFEESGWKVVYDKPAYNENYEATFTFTPKG